MSIQIINSHYYMCLIILNTRRTISLPHGIENYLFLYLWKMDFLQKDWIDNFLVTLDTPHINNKILNLFWAPLQQLTCQKMLVCHFLPDLVTFPVWMSSCCKHHLSIYCNLSNYLLAYATIFHLDWLKFQVAGPNVQLMITNFLQVGQETLL